VPEGKRLKGGYITVTHTHGRNGQYHPHLHVIATSGGYDEVEERWEHLSFLPYELLRHKWQWHLMDTCRKTLATDEMKRLVDQCYRKYPVVWWPTCKREEYRRSIRAWRATWPNTW
jgi:hypothetical protein